MGLFGNRGSKTTGDEIQVLHVEDEAMTRKLVQGMLKTGGFEVRQVSSLTSGMYEVMKQPFHVAILDLNTGDSEGADTMAEFRERFPDIPVVVLSGASGETLEHVKSIGADKVLLKSELNADILQEALRSVCSP